MNFKAKNIDLTDSIKQYAEDKISMLEKYIDIESDTNIFAELEIGKEVSDQHSGDIFISILNLEIGGELYRVESETDNLYAAIDEVKDEATRVLRKGKNKKRDLVRRGALKIKNMVRGWGKK